MCVGSCIVLSSGGRRGGQGRIWSSLGKMPIKSSEIRDRDRSWPTRPKNEGLSFKSSVDNRMSCYLCCHLTPRHSHCPPLGVGVGWSGRADFAKCWPKALRFLRMCCWLFFTPSLTSLTLGTSIADWDRCLPHTPVMFPSFTFPSRLPLHSWSSYLPISPKGNIECHPAWASHLLR